VKQEENEQPPYPCGSERNLNEGDAVCNKSHKEGTGDALVMSTSAFLFVTFA